MEVVITGGGGFIGRRLAAHLVGLGHGVRILDLHSPQVHGLQPIADIEGAETTVADVRDRAALLHVLNGATHVVHLAAETGVGQSMYEIERYVSVNDGGTAALLQALIDRGEPIDRLVLSSSRAVYGEGRYACADCGIVHPMARRQVEPNSWNPPCPRCGGSITPLPTDEASPLRPASVYGVTKMAQELLIDTVSSAYGISAIRLRYFNVYGPGQSLNNPYTGILAAFLRRALDGQPIDVFEDGLETRDFVFVDDVVAATARALEVPTSSVPDSVVNVGSGSATSLLDLAIAVRDLVGSASEVRVTGGWRMGDVRHAVADTTSAAEQLGVIAQVGLPDGLQQWCGWAIRHVDQRSEFSVAAEQLALRGLYRPA